MTFNYTLKSNHCDCTLETVWRTERVNGLKFSDYEGLTCESFIMLVTSGWILFAIPKSISLSDAFTITKFAGFKSLWTIPEKQDTYIQNQSRLLNYSEVTYCDRKTEDGWWSSIEGDRKKKVTMFMNGLDGLQHVLPVELPLQWIHCFAVSQPSVEIQVSTLHQHVDVAVGYFTAIIHWTII